MKKLNKKVKWRWQWSSGGEEKSKFVLEITWVKVVRFHLKFGQEKSHLVKMHKMSGSLLHQQWMDNADFAGNPVVVLTDVMCVIWCCTSSVGWRSENNNTGNSFDASGVMMKPKMTMRIVVIASFFKKPRKLATQHRMHLWPCTHRESWDNRDPQDCELVHQQVIGIPE